MGFGLRHGWEAWIDSKHPPMKVGQQCIGESSRRRIRVLFGDNCGNFAITRLLLFCGVCFPCSSIYGSKEIVVGIGSFVLGFQKVGERDYNSG